MYDVIIRHFLVVPSIIQIELSGNIIKNYLEIGFPVGVFHYGCCIRYIPYIYISKYVGAVIGSDQRLANDGWHDFDISAIGKQK